MKEGVKGRNKKKERIDIEKCGPGNKGVGIISCTVQ